MSPFLFLLGHIWFFGLFWEGPQKEINFLIPSQLVIRFLKEPNRNQSNSSSFFLGNYLNYLRNFTEAEDSRMGRIGLGRAFC